MDVRRTTLMKESPNHHDDRRRDPRGTFRLGHRDLPPFRVALARTPPNVGGHRRARIVLTCGGALLKNLDKRLMSETGLSGFHRPPDDPLLLCRARQQATIRSDFDYSNSLNGTIPLRQS